MKSITEEMKYRQRLCEYALKYGVTKAARRYHTYRQFVYRQLEKYDGTVQSLALRSRRPHTSPNSHTDDELKLIKRMLKRNGIYGLAEVYVRCQSKGYTRSLFFVKYFSLKKASEFPFFSKGFSLPSAGIMHPCA